MKPTDIKRIRAAALPEGTIPTRRKGGWTDYADLVELVRAGLLETRESGPRGGRRFHATAAGMSTIGASA